MAGWNAALHPRAYAGRFTETFRADPGDVELAEPVGHRPHLPERPDDGPWQIADPRVTDDGWFMFSGWSNLAARQAAAIASLPGAADAPARFEHAARQKRTVTVTYLDRDHVVCVQELQMITDSDGDIICHEPGDDRWGWWDTEQQVIAVEDGADADTAANRWVDHIAWTVPDLGPVSYDGLPEADQTRIDAPIMAAYILHGRYDEQHAGAVFLAQARDGNGAFGVICRPGRDPEPMLLLDDDIGGRVVGFRPGSISHSEALRFCTDPATMYRAVC